MKILKELLIFAVLAVLIATVARSEENQCEDITYLTAGKDQLEISESSEGHWAELRYLNEGDTTTNNGSTIIGSYTLVYECVEVVVVLDFARGSSAETIVILPSDFFVALPEEATVPDGTDIIIQLAQPMF